MAQDLEALRQQVEGLSAQVAALTAAAHSVSLRLVGEAPYVGQPATILVSVTDASGAPLVGGTVTLVTSWGLLRWVDGVDVHRGTTVSVRTGPGGGARVSLRAATSEELDGGQESALTVALWLLDPASASPTDALPALQEIGRRYRWEANAPLRQAVDVYVRDLGRGVLDSVTAWDPTTTWRTVEAAVVGYVTAGDDARPAGTGVVSVSFRDWIAPWLRAYEDLAASVSTLPQGLADVRVLGGSDAGSLLQGAVERARDYVRDEPGLVGTTVGPRIARSALQAFADGTTDLPLATQLALHPAASAVSDAVGAGSVEAAGAVTQARTDLGQRIDTTDRTVTLSVDELRTTVGDVRTSFSGLSDLVGTKADATALVSVQSAVDAKANAADVVALQGALANKADAAEVIDVRNQLALKANATDVVTLQDRVNVLNNDVLQRINIVAGQFNDINNRVLSIHQRLGGDG